MAKKDRIRLRALFLSDVHLGTRGSQADLLLDFLKHHEADVIYLVGDIIDGWQLKSGWYWPQAHNDVVRKLLKRVHNGTKLVYVPGNHDEFMRDYVGNNFGGIDILDPAIHEAADGRRFLVIHGDHFDLVVRHAPWLASIGDGAYTLALTINTYLNKIRRRLGFSYWSLSAWAKLKVKRAVNHIGKFEELLSLEASRYNTDGVICGHIHHAVIQEQNGICYMNTGDWVESCTALVEHFDGRFELIRWADELRQRDALKASKKVPIEEAAAEASAA